MLRSLEVALVEWKSSVNRKPLLVRGARQVGKSYLIEKFGQTHFDDLIVANFEFEPQFKACFQSYDPQKIISAIETIVKKNIHPGSTLLFLDEIQECPEAIMSLRYFKEKMPTLHVIGAGSLLEFSLNGEGFQQPVGRVQSYYLQPCSFKEFLLASGDHRLVEYLHNVTITDSITSPYHDLLIQKCREYFAIGGMPEVVHYYTQQQKLIGCQPIQASILEYYQKDFPKYGDRINSKALQKIFTKAPAMIAKHFKYVDIDPNIQAKTQKPALEALENAGIITPIYHSSAVGVPLNTTINEKKFKLLFLDIGLVSQATRLEISTLLNEHLILLNKGALAEQFVGQEIIAYGNYYEKPQLFYWEREKRGAQAEVDYLLQYGSEILPLEVKSGKTGRLKSLRIFMQEKKCSVGIRVSQNQLSFNEGILSIPLYMVSEIPRLLESV